VHSGTDFPHGALRQKNSQRSMTAPSRPEKAATMGGLAAVLVEYPDQHQSGSRKAHPDTASLRTPVFGEPTCNQLTAARLNERVIAESFNGLSNKGKREKPRRVGLDPASLCLT
jgi:hypothetical protein